MYARLENKSKNLFHTIILKQIVARYYSPSILFTPLFPSFLFSSSGFSFLLFITSVLNKSITCILKLYLSIFKKTSRIDYKQISDEQLSNKIVLSTKNANYCIQVYPNTAERYYKPFQQLFTLIMLTSTPESLSFETHHSTKRNKLSTFPANAACRDARHGNPTDYRASHFVFARTNPNIRGLRCDTTMD